MKNQNIFSMFDSEAETLSENVSYFHLFKSQQMHIKIFIPYHQRLKMKHSFLFYISLIFASVIYPSTVCNGLMRKLNSETDPIALMCRKTTDFGFCVYTLRSDPRSAGADTNGLAHIAVDKLQTQAKDTSKYLQELQGEVSDSEGKRAIGTCIHFYELATNKDVPSALASMNAKAYGNAVNAASAAKNDEERCEEGINKNPSPDFQKLREKNIYMRDLSQLAIDVIGLLGK